MIPMRRVLLAAGLVLLTACNQNVDLNSLQALGKTMNAQQKAYDAIAQDFYGACQRQALWALPASRQAVVNDEKANAQLAEELNRRLSRLPAEQQDAVRKAQAATLLLDPCRTSAVAARDWQKSNLILLNYFRALSNVAGGNEDPTQDYGMSGLAKELKNSKILSSDQATTLTSALASVIGDVFNAKRRDAIATDAPAAQDAVNAVIKELKHVGDSDYRIVLKNERGALESFYRGNIADAQPGMQALDKVRYHAEWTAAENEVNDKYAALDAYLTSLDDLQAAHDALVAHIGSHGFTGLASIVQGYVHEFQPKYEAIVKAFKVGGTTGA